MAILACARGDDALLHDEKLLPHFARMAKFQLLLIPLMENKHTLGCTLKKTRYFLMHEHNMNWDEHLERERMLILKGRNYHMK